LLSRPPPPLITTPDNIVARFDFVMDTFGIISSPMSILYDRRFVSRDTTWRRRSFYAIIFPLLLETCSQIQAAKYLWKEFQGKAEHGTEINIFSKASCDIKREKNYILEAYLPEILNYENWKNQINCFWHVYNKYKKVLKKITKYNKACNSTIHVILDHHRILLRDEVV
jgi:hypothetical protein